jgi:DMSO/TMAO reductase YedYZ heme-binding membrane subunit
MQNSRSQIAGWPIVGWVTVILIGLIAALLAINGTGEEGLRSVIRATAQTSLVLFLAAFVASAWQRIRRSAASRWLLANRRYVGVSFAVSHALHLAFIIALANTAAFRRDDEIETTTLIFGGLGYVFIAAMAATSFDRTAAWIGRRAWRRLHTVGAYYVWAIFVLSYVPRAVMAPAYAPLALVLFAALGLRLAARMRAPGRVGVEVTEA